MKYIASYASAGLSRKAAKLYKLPPTVLPVSQGGKAKPDAVQPDVVQPDVVQPDVVQPDVVQSDVVQPDFVQKELGPLGYPGFEHVRSRAACNPAEVVLHAVLNRDLDTRLVEALRWVLGAFPDLRWDWLRDNAKLHNAQNRLGYLFYMARKTAPPTAAQVLSRWEAELEEARLAGEGTLCRDSMPEREREWVRTNRPAAAAHWNLLTSLTAEQLPYVQ